MGSLLLGAALARAASPAVGDPAALSEQAPAAPSAHRTGLYMGRTWVSQPKHLPVIGTLEARTDTLVLARLREEDGVVHIEQVACEVRIKPTAGVRVQMEEGAARRMPAARFELRPSADGTLAGAWATGWGREDVEGDGLPGLSLRVQASLCSGQLQVSSQTWSAARAWWQDGALHGEVEVELQQEILEASGACLRMAAKDTAETLRGGMIYQPVPEGTSCANLPPLAPP